MLFSSMATMTTCGLGRCGAAQRLPRVEQHQVRDPHRRHDLGHEADQHQHAYGGSRPAAQPLARDELLVEEAAGVDAHGVRAYAQLRAGIESCRPSTAPRPRLRYALRRVRSPCWTLFDASLVGRAGEPALDLGPAGGPVRTLTFGELEARSERMAGALAARGVRGGDRLAVQLPNGREFLELFLACLRLGALFVPVNVLYREREVATSSPTPSPRPW